MHYEETQTSRVLTITLGIALVSVIAATIPVLLRAPEAARTTIPLVMLFPLLVLGVLFVKIRKLQIQMDSQILSFGFPPFVSKIPLKEIDAIRIVKLGLFNSGGWGIRWTIGGRWAYVAALGSGVEIDWGKKKRTFSTGEPERIMQALNTMCPGKVTDAR